MARWFTADPHFGHANIIKHCRRPFDDVDAMDAALIATISDIVADRDELWVLGDVAMRTQRAELVSLLPGRKILVVGNHDKPFRGTPEKVAKATAMYRDAGFDEIIHGTTTITLADGRSVLASHFPYEGDSGERDRYVAQRPIDRGQWLLHGHVHERWRQRGRMINVGVDAWAGRPVAEADIIGLIAAGPQDQECLPWSW